MMDTKINFNRDFIKELTLKNLLIKNVDRIVEKLMESEREISLLLMLRKKWLPPLGEKAVYLNNRNEVHYEYKVDVKFPNFKEVLKKILHKLKYSELLENEELFREVYLMFLKNFLYKKIHKNISSEMVYNYFKSSIEKYNIVPWVDLPTVLWELTYTKNFEGTFSIKIFMVYVNRYLFVLENKKEEIRDLLSKFFNEINQNNEKWDIFYKNFYEDFRNAFGHRYDFDVLSALELSNIFCEEISFMKRVQIQLIEEEGLNKYIKFNENYEKFVLELNEKIKKFVSDFLSSENFWINLFVSDNIQKRRFRRFIKKIMKNSKNNKIGRLF